MADVVDEYGNQIPLTDELGNPVQLTDEHGNPMHLTGIAVHPRSGVVATETKVEIAVDEPPLAVYEATAPDVGVVVEPKQETLMEKLAHEDKQPVKMGRSSSSSSSSSEDDGKGGRRKKKGIKEKIKEKLGVGKHKDKDEHAPYPTTVTSETRPGEHHLHHDQQVHEKKSVMEKLGMGKHKDKDEHTPYPTTVTSETRPGEPHLHHDQQVHEKKSVMEKIKEKLPGHHHH